jgi:hypothetical protein
LLEREMTRHEKHPAQATPISRLRLVLAYPRVGFNLIPERARPFLFSVD